MTVTLVSFCGCAFLIFLASLFLCDADALSLDSWSIAPSQNALSYFVLCFLSILISHSITSPPPICIKLSLRFIIHHLPLIILHHHSSHHRADTHTAIPTVSKKRAPAKSNKRKQPTPDDSSPTLAGSSPPPELQAPKKKIKSTTPKRKTKAKQSLTPETEETDEDRINAKAIAAGRARYVADKLAAEVKVKVEHPSHDEEDFDEEKMGMNVDSGEDEGLTAVELIEKEVFGEGVEA